MPYNFFFDGSPEVSLFLVLSGFVLTRAYAPRGADLKKLSFLNILTARTTRLYPAFGAVFLLSLLAKDWAYAHAVSAEHAQLLARYWPDTLGGVRLLQQLSLLPFEQRGTPVVPPDWTLVLEVKYSLLLPVLLLVLHKSRFWLAAIVVGMVALFTRTDALFLGFGSGMLLAATSKAFVPKLTKAHPAIRAALLLASVAVFYVAFVPFPYVMLTACIASALLLAFLMSAPRAQRLLQARPLRALGQVSYSLYLCHFFILLCLAPHWRAWTVQWPGGIFVDLGLSAAFCLGLAALLYRFVERPGIELGKALRER